MDVTDTASFERMAREVSAAGLDVVVNNADTSMNRWKR